MREQEKQYGADEPQISPRQRLYIQMAIDQYHSLYIPAANAQGLDQMSEADYVVLALENYDQFEAHIEQCKLFGHQMQTIFLAGHEITACCRCGVTEQLSEIILIAQGLHGGSSSSTADGAGSLNG